jgi:hypothetical protein
MIFLVKENDKVRVFFSETEMKEAGFNKAGLKVTEEKYNSSGCYARLIDGEIVVGKTAAEIANEEKQEQIAGCMAQLEQIDMESGASRHVRDVSVSAGVVLDAVRVLLSKFAKELSISLPPGFGAGIASAADIISLAPASNATQKEKDDFAVCKALLLVSHYDPTINPGLTKIREAEIASAPIREQLAVLTG